MLLSENLTNARCPGLKGEEGGPFTVNMAIEQSEPCKPKSTEIDRQAMARFSIVPMIVYDGRN